MKHEMKKLKKTPRYVTEEFHAKHHAGSASDIFRSTCEDPLFSPPPKISSPFFVLNNRTKNQNYYEKKTFPVFCAFVRSFCGFCTKGFLLHKELRDGLLPHLLWAGLSAQERRVPCLHRMAPQRHHCEGLLAILPNSRRLDYARPDRYGFPTISMVGKHASTQAFLLLQHSPYIRKYYKLIKRAYLNGEIDPVQYAMVTDRLLTEDGKPQGHPVLPNGRPYRGYSGIMPMSRPVTCIAMSRQGQKLGRKGAFRLPQTPVGVKAR